MSIRFSTGRRLCKNPKSPTFSGPENPFMNKN